MQGLVEAISIDWVIPFAEDVFSITAKRMKGNMMKPSPFFGRLEPALLCDQLHIIASEDFMHLFSRIWKKLTFAGELKTLVIALFVFTLHKFTMLEGGLYLSLTLKKHS